MKPAPFDYVRAASIEDAAAALASADGGGKLIAGGQSLGPMLNLRLVQPSLLIDISGVAELTAVSEDADGLTIGAGVTAAVIEDGRLPTGTAPMLPRIAGGIAYRAVRNRGTIGGSLCHADPAADWVNTLPALGATCVIGGERGATRRVPVADFMTAAFENALAETELLRAIIVPKISRAARFGYAKISRKTGKFAMASGVVLFDPERDIFRAVIGATHGKPIVVADARALFGERPLAQPLRFDEGFGTDLLARNGVAAGAPRRLHLTALRRAAEEAFSREVSAP
ncbi:FAD binding domain-containing protein [Chelatococcus sp. GCM10030263]|uniref:FAD binding domain-containing protein n=1 Tax=Chelatococcus sp. GCM10030263 TaxID=3273387 RepID=UPI0036212E98